MGLRHIFSLILLSVPALTVGAQTRSVPHYANVALGDVRHTSDSTATASFNLGLFSAVDTLTGFQTGLFSSVVRADMRGFGLGGLISTVGRDARGVTLGGFVNSVGGVMRGVQIGGVSNIARSLRGVQIAALSNISNTPLRGLQLGGVTNISMGVSRGVQLSALVNVCSSTMHGFQLAPYNYADTLHGLQLGLINVALRRPRGLQVGLVNYSRDADQRKVGLVNISPLTDIDVLLSAGNTTKFNAALRFRNRHTYSIVGMGTHYMGLDKRFSGALYYRVGPYLRLSPRWTLGADLGFSHIETFEHNSQSKPEHLYSLQTTLNADYRLTPVLGLFASVGYADTRRYGSHQRYEHKFVGNIGLSVAYNRHRAMRPAKSSDDRSDALSLSDADPRFALPMKKHYWLAAAQATAVNALVFSFDRFVMNEDFAQVNIHTIRDNFKTGFVWDNDPFSTNLFAHPYHGSLYFNSARSNGLDFWESVPYAVGGSLMWELFAECEPPAINDLMATSMGGVAIGEITGRLSRLVLNDRTRGFSRFAREALAFIVNPMQGINRLVRGDATRVRHDHYLYHDYNRMPVHLDVSLGARYLADDGALFRGEHNPYVKIYLEYGDALGDTENKPYDYFTASLTLGLSANQPLLNQARLLGRLWAAPLYAGHNIEAQFGIFQHFSFYNSEPVKDGTSLTPYRISEAVSFGPGMIYRFHNAGNLARLEQRLFANGIILGGSKSDYYNVIDRDYNMGSGFSLKSNTSMAFQRLGLFALNIEYYRIYTWRGYEDRDLSDRGPLYYNVQGDRSSAELMVLSPLFRFRLGGNVSAELSGSYFMRTTRYKYHPDVRSNTFEIKVGLMYGI